MSILQSVGYKVGLPVNSTSTSFTLASGRTTTKPNGLIMIGNAEGERLRNLDLVFFGTGSDGGQFDAQVDVVNVMFNPNNGEIVDYDVQNFCQVAGVLGTGAGVASPPDNLPTGTPAKPYLHTGHLICDELTLSSVSTYATKMVTMFKGLDPFVHSPSSNGQAHLCIPDLCNATGFVVDFDLGSNVTSMNFLWRAGT